MAEFLQTRYIYDGMLVVQERSSGNTPTVTYTRGTDVSGTIQGAGGIAGLLGRSSGYSAGSWTTRNHYHTDGNGNISSSSTPAEPWRASSLLKRSLTLDCRPFLRCGEKRRGSIF